MRESGFRLKKDLKIQPSSVTPVHTPPHLQQTLTTLTNPPIHPPAFSILFNTYQHPEDQAPLLPQILQQLHPPRQPKLDLAKPSSLSSTMSSNPMTTDSKHIHMEIDPADNDTDDPSPSRRCNYCRTNPKKSCYCCLLLFLLLPPLLFYFYVLIYRTTLTASNDTWSEYLKTPPPEIITATDSLNLRAQTLVDTSLSSLTIPYNLDVVISGGGFLSYYYLGVSTILNSLESLNQTKLHRFSGASAGAQAPFKNVVLGNELHIESSLSYALIFSSYSNKFDNMLNAAITADFHWRTLAEYLEDLCTPEILEALTEKVYVSITLLFPWSNKLISIYTSKEQAQQAFLATGSMFINYEGNLAIDGGATDCAPRFKDGKRSQLIVELLNSELPMRNVVSFKGLEEVLKAVEMGQDDFVEFLKGGEKKNAFMFVDERESWGTFTC